MVTEFLVHLFSNGYQKKKHSDIKYSQQEKIYHVAEEKRSNLGWDLTSGTKVGCISVIGVVLNAKSKRIRPLLLGGMRRLRRVLSDKSKRIRFTLWLRSMQKLAAITKLAAGGK